MIQSVTAAVVVGLWVAGSATAQTTTPSSEAQTPSSEKQETSCNPSAAASNAGTTGQTTSSSMAMEKSAILPSASQHANSAAPTVQSGGKPMEVRPDCPPESKSK